MDNFVNIVTTKNEHKENSIITFANGNRKVLAKSYLMVSWPKYQHLKGNTKI